MQRIAVTGEQKVVFRDDLDEFRRFLAGEMIDFEWRCSLDKPDIKAIINSYPLRPTAEDVEEDANALLSDTIRIQIDSLETTAIGQRPETPQLPRNSEWPVSSRRKSLLLHSALPLWHRSKGPRQDMYSLPTR